MLKPPSLDIRASLTKIFQDVLQSLDAADIRLQKTMDVLRSTIVEAAFRPADESPRSLLDFIDENSVEVMRTALKDSIDRSQVRLSQNCR
jgi:autophagy-related protein 17